MALPTAARQGNEADGAQMRGDGTETRAPYTRDAYGKGEDAPPCGGEAARESDVAGEARGWGRRRGKGGAPYTRGHRKTKGGWGPALDVVECPRY